jgi:hypothetical protein
MSACYSRLKPDALPKGRGHAMPIAMDAITFARDSGVSIDASWCRDERARYLKIWIAPIYVEMRVHVG